ncbi:hypothetical protein DX541_09740 [Vibrio fluvialis]|nr:hypothetical protein AL475_12840 [Vibrio fluvialis]EKO3991559.1 hypothetical protein [Vibrio fluvialis]TOY94107.1 hypothetical protein DJ016_08930 [Vibrio fluvialis]TRN09580.1 hypothetical protein DM587_18370 [Vibrio fluvialis]
MTEASVQRAGMLVCICVAIATFMAGEPATKPDISSEANVSSVIQVVVMKFRRIQTKFKQTELHQKWCNYNPYP